MSPIPGLFCTYFIQLPTPARCKPLFLIRSKTLAILWLSFQRASSWSLGTHCDTDCSHSRLPAWQVSYTLRWSREYLVGKLCHLQAFLFLRVHSLDSVEPMLKYHSGLRVYWKCPVWSLKVHLSSHLCGKWLSFTIGNSVFVDKARAVFYSEVSSALGVSELRVYNVVMDIYIRHSVVTRSTSGGCHLYSVWSF